MKKFLYKLNRFLFSHDIAQRITGIICTVALVLSAVPRIDALSAEDMSAAASAGEMPFADKLKAVCLVAGSDFGADGLNTSARQNECLDILTELQTVGINTIVIRSSSGGKSYFSSNIDNINDDRYAVEYMTETARKCGFRVYMTLDLGLLLENDKPDSLALAPDAAAHSANGFTARNGVDGVIIENWVFNRSDTNYADYMKNGGGIGYDKWLNELTSKTLRCVSNAIVAADSTVSVGIVPCESDDALPDCTDIDFVFAQTALSTKSTQASLGTYLDDLDALCESGGASAFICVANENVCTSADGWSGRDELVRIMLELEKRGFCAGVAFGSLSAMLENAGESTDALADYFFDRLDVNTLDNALTVSMPARAEYSTTEKTVLFMGSFDGNFSLTINGEEVVTEEKGEFVLECELAVGQNTFVLENKGETRTFIITRNIGIFKNSTLSPSGDIIVDGGTKVSISVYAYKDAEISASLNGRTVTMRKTAADGGDESSSYVCYSGSYTVPDGIIGKAQEMGRVSVFGSYDGTSTSLSGGRVTVAAAEEPKNVIYTENGGVFAEIPEKVITSEIISASGGVGVTNPAGTCGGTVVKITTENSPVYPSSTTGNVPYPIFMRLESGTLDFLHKKIEYDDTEYYITKSGRRVKASDASLLEESSLSSNAITADCAYTEGNNTVIRLNRDARTPYTVLFSPLQYNKNSYGDWGDYFVSEFKPDEVKIAFDYCTAGIGSFSFPEGALFSGSSWCLEDIDGTKKVVLVLKLKNSGKYSGVTVSYDEGGVLFSFNGIENSLSGMTVVIDPGHGYIAEGKYDPGALGNFRSRYGVNYQEASVNQDVAVLVEKKLSALGVNVIRYKTESQIFATEDRANLARQYNPDLYISIHSNGSVNSAAQGNSAYYHTPFSFPLAKAVNDAISAFYANEIYGESKSEGTFYDYFFVTTQPDFPSILLELGYITNYREASVISNPEYQDKLADAIVKGISDYVSR